MSYFLHKTDLKLYVVPIMNILFYYLLFNEIQENID